MSMIPLPDKIKHGLEIFIETGSIKEVASRLQVPRGTVYYWMRSNEWKAAIKEISDRIFDELAQRAAVSVHIAFDTVMEVMQTPNPTSFNQLKAAEMVFSFAQSLNKPATNEDTNQGKVIFMLPEKGSINIVTNEQIDDSNDSSQ